MARVVAPFIAFGVAFMPLVVATGAPGPMWLSGGIDTPMIRLIDDRIPAWRDSSPFWLGHSDGEFGGVTSAERVAQWAPPSYVTWMVALGAQLGDLAGARSDSEASAVDLVLSFLGAAARRGSGFPDLVHGTAGGGSGAGGGGATGASGGGGGAGSSSGPAVEPGNSDAGTDMQPPTGGIDIPTATIPTLVTANVTRPVDQEPAALPSLTSDDLSGSGAGGSGAGGSGGEDVSAVPVPAALPLLLAGLGALGFLRRGGQRRPKATMATA